MADLNRLTGILMVLLLSIILASCIAKPEASSVQSLENTVWRLAAPEAMSGPPTSRVTLEFKQGQMSGNGGCNQLFANYQQNDSTLSIAQVGRSKRYCVDTMALEDRLLELLQQVSSYARSGTELRLYYPGGELLFIAE